MLDLKSILRAVLQQGLEDFGYGVKSVGSVSPAVGSNAPVITLKRSGAQDEDDRPLITLRRIAGPRTAAFYVGNVVPTQSAYTPALPYAYAIMGEDRVRIGIEAFQDTGGQSLVDVLMLQIPTMLLQNWDAMTFPTEAGGYGLYNATFRGAEDVVRSNEAGGKAVYANSIDFTAQLLMDTMPGTPTPTTIDYIAIDPILANVDPNNPNFQPD